MAEVPEPPVFPAPPGTDAAALMTWIEELTTWAEDLPTGGGGGGGTGVIYHDLDTSAGTRAFTLPTAAADGEVHAVKDITGGHPPGVGAITVTATGGYLIDNSTTFPAPPLYWGNLGSYEFRWNASLSKWLVG